MAKESEKKRTPPEEMDALRVRALRGSKLADLSESKREWVWRSRVQRATKGGKAGRGGFSEEQYDQRVERVRRWYEARIAAYKAQPKVVRPVKPPVRPQRKGIWRWIGGNR